MRPRHRHSHLALNPSKIAGTHVCAMLARMTGITRKHPAFPGRETHRVAQKIALRVARKTALAAMQSMALTSEQKGSRRSRSACSMTSPPRLAWHLNGPGRRRVGRIEVVYVAHMPGAGIVSAAALAEIEINFDEVEQELRTEAGERLRGHAESWGFVRRQGMIADELIAVAKDIRDANASGRVAIVVGSSSHAMHRVVGSVAVSLSRHSPVPLVIVP